MQLNHRQLLFCQHYLKTGFAGEAYKLAYGMENDDHARANASRLLSNVVIKEYIESFHKQMEEQTKITVESVLKGIYEIATKESARDSDKLKAYELLGRHLNIFSDKAPAAALPPVTDKDETEHK